MLYSLPVTRSLRKTPGGSKREEGRKNAFFFVGKPGHGRPAVALYYLSKRAKSAPNPTQ